MRSGRSCRVLREQGRQNAAGTYRSWKRPRIAPRTMSDATTMDLVRDLAWTTDLTSKKWRLAPEGLYGRRKMLKSVRRKGLPNASFGTVGAMRQLGLSGNRRDVKRRAPITSKDGSGPVICSAATSPQRRRTRCGSTISPTSAPLPGRGWVYVALIVDVFARRIVSWHATTCKDTDLVMTPDAGSQYTSIRYTDHLDLEEIKPSIGSVGDAYALMQTINGLYKAECIRTTVFHDGAYKTIAEVEFATSGWVNRYNQRRLHGSAGMISPVEFETAHYAALTTEPELV